MGKQDWDRMGHWGRVKLGRWDRVVGIGMMGMEWLDGITDRWDRMGWVLGAGTVGTGLNAGMGTGVTG